jgi:cobalt-zinc-cadmium efflux system protein
VSSHAHEHGGHTGHAHGVSAGADSRKLAVALALILGFMVVEVVAGLMAGSLALLSDAGHMLTDAAAIAFSLIAIRLAARPAQGVMTYGLKRVEILSAQANGVSLLVLALLILFEAVRRLIDPPGVEGGVVLAVALVGVVVNLAATWTLSRANRGSLNIEGSFQHILTDLYAFIATAVAGGIVLWTGWLRCSWRR